MMQTRNRTPGLRYAKRPTPVSSLSRICLAIAIAMASVVLICLFGHPNVAQEFILGKFTKRGGHMQ